MDAKGARIDGSVLDSIRATGTVLPFPILVVNEGGIVVMASELVRDELGYTPEELVGRPVADLIPESSRDKHGNLMMGYWKNPERRMMARGLPLTARRKDGVETPVDVTLTPFEVDGERLVLCVVRDLAEQIADHRQHLQETQGILEGVEDALEARNQMLAEVRAMQSWFIGADSPGDEFDALLERMLRFTSSEYGFIGQILHEEDGTPYLHTFAVTNIAWDEATRRFYDENAPTGMIFRNMETLFGAAITSGEIVVANSPGTDHRSGGLPDGHPDLNAFLGVPFVRDGVPVGMVGLANRPGGYSQRYVESVGPLLDSLAQIVIAHRTEVARTAAVEVVKSQKDALTVANIRLSEALKTRNKFMSMVSHELRSPLTPILGFSEGLSYGIYGEVTADQRRVLSNINESGSRLMKLIDDILDYARSDVNPAEIELTTVNVEALLESCRTMMASAADLKGIAIEMDIESGPLHVLSSESHLKKMVMALLENAVKFTPEGGSVGLRARRVEGGVEIEVWDSGIGIDPEAYERIFEPFIQLDHGKSRHFEGSGLGLALAAKLAGLHGTSIEVESELEKGSRFTFRCAEAG